MQVAMRYMIMLFYRNIETDKCYPLISVIAEEGAIFTQIVGRMIKELYSKGYLIIDSGERGVLREAV